MEKATIGIDSLCYTTDNGRPRRNAGKPHHGAFDAGHLDVCAAMTLCLTINNEDSVSAASPSAFRVSITDFHAVDRGSGLQVDSLHLNADIGKDSLLLSDVELCLPHSTISFAAATLVGTRRVASATVSDSVSAPMLHYHVPEFTATTQIRDIACPFAPVLKNFTTPLRVRCAITGDADGMRFDHVNVEADGLRIDASGRISHLREKELLHVHFDVNDMTSTIRTAEQIINHFPVKKMMMKQLRALGHIGYKGHFDVHTGKSHPSESFAGRLRTDAGDIRLNLVIDERDKYLSGSVDTDSLHLGRVMGMEDLERIACSASFRFDISKPRTAVMRREKGGKLPIGNVEAEVREGHYKHIKVHDLSATITSDGAVAEGIIIDKMKLFDLTCSFSFTDTDEMHKLKVKPGIKFHHRQNSPQ